MILFLEFINKVFLNKLIYFNRKEIKTVNLLLENQNKKSMNIQGLKNTVSEIKSSFDRFHRRLNITEKGISEFEDTLIEGILSETQSSMKITMEYVIHIQNS